MLSQAILMRHIGLLNSGCVVLEFHKLIQFLARIVAADRVALAVVADLPIATVADFLRYS